MTTEIETKHNDEVIIKIGKNKFYITIHDFEQYVNFAISAIGKSSLNMKIKPILENKISLEIPK